MNNSIEHYKKIADAIAYIQQNFRKQPSLDDIAKHVHISPFHFHRIFTEWAGVSPKKFLQYISIEHAKEILKTPQATLFDASMETGLSGTSRLHDLFLSIEGMSPGEYKNGGENLVINYRFLRSPFGKILIASTMKGVCFLAFEDDKNTFAHLQKQFPNAIFKKSSDEFQEKALMIFTENWSNLSQIKLHLKATPFQLKVWQALLSIPFGKLTTYKNISKQILHPNAHRAVGTAIGHNPVAYIIPCHRVIQTSGKLGGYMWGIERKSAILGWEFSKETM